RRPRPASMSLADLNPIPVSAVEVGARPLVAMAAGALIGDERQWHHRAAGVRTHALLALGAAGFALIAHLLAVRDPQMNPAQITAGVVSGIGFLCGGVILHRGGSVQGLTTAASLWTTAGVGLAIGGGRTTPSPLERAPGCSMCLSSSQRSRRRASVGICHHRAGELEATRFITQGTS